MASRWLGPALQEEGFDEAGLLERGAVVELAAGPADRWPRCRDAGLAPGGGCSKVHAGTASALASRSMFPSAMFQVERSTADT